MPARSARSLLLLALAGPRAETATLLLAGLAISALAGALTTLALALAPSPFAFYDAYDWLMGSLVDRSLAQAAFAALSGAVDHRSCCCGLRGRSTASRSARRSPQSLGHDVRRLRLQIVCLTAIGVGACVAICGAIGFVGLVAPIFARRLTGGHPGRAIAAGGADRRDAADRRRSCCPRSRRSDGRLPIGVVTALLGAPFFLWLVAHMRWRLAR